MNDKAILAALIGAVALMMVQGFVAIFWAGAMDNNVKVLLERSISIDAKLTAVIEEQNKMKESMVKTDIQIANMQNQISNLERKSQR